MNKTDAELLQALRESTAMLAQIADHVCTEARKIVKRQLRANRRVLEKAAPQSEPYRPGERA